MLDTKLLVESIYHLIPEFEYQFTRPVKKLTQKELTNYQSKVLTTLQNIPEISMTTLADRLVMSKSQLTATVDVLVKLGFVDRVHDENDRRKIIIHITEKGSRYLARSKCAVTDFYNLYFSQLTEEERLKLYMALAQLSELLLKMNPLSQSVTQEQLKEIMDKYAE
ncbi:MarR family transcriptional regulator [Lachnospiraceae bacterium]|jgi:DNA-binding MarR family transcriptional regulator|nr:MarR family transcriptional regulator [uncultured Schaedlerella sp.]EOS36105.1 hypothetical protein C808_04321 [Lachnospiraceae bacterium M18-1]MCI9152857.1 MarR family transcriptional regulator [Ruminococcus sp.]NBI59188.1 MarR family transcriptional regulator [Lachnospiraceae bacterium]